MKEFKSQLKSKVKHIDKGALIVTFPDSPAGLPKNVYDSVYHSEAPSTRSSTSRAGIGSAELPARSTHQKVKGSNPKAAQGGQQNLTTQDVMGIMMTFANAMAGNAASSNMNLGQLSGLRLFGNARQQKALQDAQPQFGTASSQLALPAPRTTSEPAKSPRDPARSPTEVEDTPMDSQGQDGETPPRMFNTEAPSRTPEQTVDLMDKSFKARELEKKKTKEAERAAPAEEGPALKRPAAAHAAKSSAKAKSKAQAKPKAKAEANTKQKAAEKAAEDDAEPKPSKPSPKKSSSKALKKDVAGTKPNPPDPWVGTFFWNGGKIHKNVAQSCWRVFINEKDRNDKKIKWHDDPVGAFHKALDVIDQGRKDRLQKIYEEAAQSAEPLNVD